MDVALIDCILRRRPVNLGYSIFRTILSILKLITRSLPYGHFITRLLKHLRVPIHEPSCKPFKSIGDEAISALGFEWHNEAWVKYTDKKYTFLAPSDYRPLNDMITADQLPDFLLSFRGQCRCRNRLVSASTPVLSPPEPPASKEVTLQQLIDEMRTIFL